MSATDRRARKRARRSVALVRHGRLRRSNPWLAVVKFLAAAVAVVLVSGVSVAGYAIWNIESEIETVTLVGETPGPPPQLGALEGGFNVLLVGSDRCENPESCRDRGGANLNDVTILLHVA